ARYDGPSALAAAGEIRPDVCLIDLNMPGMEGDELATLLRARVGGRPVLCIAATALADEAARRRTSDAGFWLHLVKPVDPHDLLRATTSSVPTRYHRRLRTGAETTGWG